MNTYKPPQEKIFFTLEDGDLMFYQDPDGCLGVCFRTSIVAGPQKSLSRENAAALVLWLVEHGFAPALTTFHNLGVLNLAPPKDALIETERIAFGGGGESLVFWRSRRGHYVVSFYHGPGTPPEMVLSTEQGAVLAGWLARPGTGNDSPAPVTFAAYSPGELYVGRVSPPRTPCGHYELMAGRQEILRPWLERYEGKMIEITIKEVTPSCPPTGLDCDSGEPLAG
jgi:hypothetical protein